MKIRTGVLLGAALLAGCASSNDRIDAMPFTDSAGQARTVRLIVQNRNFADARLYTLRRGARKNLGIVGGKQDAEFQIDWPQSDPMRIEIDMLAGPHCLTREMPVDPGDTLELQIQPVFSNTAGCR